MSEFVPSEVGDLISIVILGKTYRAIITSINPMPDDPDAFEATFIIEPPELSQDPP